MAKHRAYKACAVLCIAFVLTVTAAILGIMLGSTNVSFSDVIAVLTGGNPSSTPVANIVKHIRLPRVEAALLAGAALATSGCIIQTVLANPLASPNVIGVNAGSGCAVLLVSSFLPGVAFVLPFAAFGGALLVALIIFAVASYTGASRMTIVLVGMAMTAICTAGMNTILIINPDAYVGASTFLVGGLAGVKIQDLVWPAMLIIPGIIIALLGTHALNIVTAGDNVAASVGMNVRAVRLGMLALAALLAGAAVSFAGMLGFVGLIIPHVVRLASGNDARFLIPTSIFLGAAFVTFCDLAARTMFAPYEIPVGILMAFVGGPFFIWLVIRKRGGNCA
ncbi:MAG: iron ABC transporter permease [Coriobacteriales bacterium]|nr:iron ABC transporter permease [Coriobacteriales bacterium]